MSKTLLPPGCYDVLPPHARQESELSSEILRFFASYGYRQVSPPLLEYSDNLLAGRGASLSSQMFRVMDPTAHRVMAIRPDITLQIARIASGQLKGEPRPLRLSYNGLILRLTGEQLKGDRQLRQAGIELIGAGTPEADAEVIIIAARALSRAGIKKFTIDLNLPSIVAALVATDALSPDQVRGLYTALAHKDSAAIASLPLSYRKSLVALVERCGEARDVLKSIENLELPTSARELCNNLRDVVTLIEQQREAGWTITIDATESQGYAYHSGIGFTIFVPGVAHEVGRGGRYRIDGEEAAGFTLYVELLRDLLPDFTEPEKVLVTMDTAKEQCELLQSQGYATLYALPSTQPIAEQAKKLGCKYIFNHGTLNKI